MIRHVIPRLLLALALLLAVAAVCVVVWERQRRQWQARPSSDPVAPSLAELQRRRRMP